MIRPIMPKDVFEVADLAEQMHCESNFKHIAFDKKKLINNFLLALANSSMVGFVDMKDNCIVGAVAGVLDSYIFSDKMKLTGIGLFVTKRYRKSKIGVQLLKAYINAGKKLGIEQISIDSSGNADWQSFDLLCKNVGLDKIGSVHKLDLNVTA